MNTIKEVYDQLTKEELWKVKSKIRYFEDKSEQYHNALIMTEEPGHGILVHDLDIDDYVLLPVKTEVEWIGNKPKTKKRYACALWVDAYVNLDVKVHWREKERTEGPDFIK